MRRRLRKAFIDALCDLAAQDERICLLTADLGYMALEPFHHRFPHRFLNVGVAEQNMIGVATGMAEAGLLPFAYSISPFAALRPFEFIRNGPVLHRLPVRIVGMGMGFEYGHAGPTHYGVEDVGALRTLPGLGIVIPADSAQASAAIRSTAGFGAVYYSLGKDDGISVPGLGGRFEPGRLQILRSGASKLAIISMGSVSVEAAAAAEELTREHGIDPRAAVLSGFNPDPVEDTVKLLDGVAHVITVEAQTISGGLSAYVGGVIATFGLRCRLWPIAVRVSPDGTSGSQLNRWKKYGMDRTGILRVALAAQETGSMSGDLGVLETVLRT
jgi:transketolase